jgi:DHA1 family bicyclomycin/chloramphenicol resistance-like MFS transporter
MSPRLITLVLITSLAILSQNMFSPSLTNIASEFDATYARASLSISLFLAISGGVQLIMGPLSDRYGRRPVILFLLVSFTIASLATAFSVTMVGFLTARMFQAGIVGGAVISRAMIRDQYPMERATVMLSYVAMAMSIAPMIGPIIGGYFDHAYGWRSNFWIFTLLGGALFLWALYDAKETNLNPSESFKAQFQTYPILFRSVRFWGYTFSLMFSIGSFYLFLGGAPKVALIEYGLTSEETGLGLGIISMGFFVGNFASSRLAGRLGLHRLIMLGRWVTLFGVGTFVLVQVVFTPHVLLFFTGAIFVGLGNGLSLPSLNVAVMSVRPEIAGSASGLSGTLTVFGGGAFTAISGSILPDDGAGVMLLSFIWLSALSALICAAWVNLVEKRRAIEEKSGVAD